MSVVIGLFAAPLLASPIAECIDAKLEPSLGLINRMKTDGLDLNKRRVVSQLFLGPKDQLEIAKRKFGGLGQTIDPAPGPGRLLVLSNVSVSESWARGVIPAMCKIAAESGVEYDGWDIDVASDNIKSKAPN